MNVPFICLILFSLNFYAFKSSAQSDNPFFKFMGANCHIGLLNQYNKEILPASFTNITIAPVGNNWLISAAVKNHYSYHFQIENELIKLPYNHVEILNDRLLKVGSPGAYGIINTTGAGVLLMNYENILPAGTEFAITLYKKLYGCVDLDGNSVIPNQYDLLLHWQAAGFWAYKYSQFHLIDHNGMSVLGLKYDKVLIPDVDLPICGVAKNGQWGAVNQQNELVLNIDYDEIMILDMGVVAVKDRELKWKLTDLNGKLKNKEEYDAIVGLGNKGIVVTKDGKKGLLDYQAKSLIDVKYDDLQYLGNNWVSVNNNKEVLIYSIKENKFLDFIFEDIKTTDYTQRWEGVLIKKDSKWGWLDFNMNLKIKPIYTNVRLNYTNIIIVENENKKIGILDKNGDVVIPDEYTEIVPQNEYFKVKKEGTDWYYVNKKNKKVNCQVF